jgi:hypothetical protein
VIRDAILIKQGALAKGGQAPVGKAAKNNGGDDDDDDDDDGGAAPWLSGKFDESRLLPIPMGR